MTARHRGETKHHWSNVWAQVGEVGKIVVVPATAAERPPDGALEFLVPWLGVDGTGVLLVLVPTAIAARKVPKVAAGLVAAAREALSNRERGASRLPDTAADPGAPGWQRHASGGRSSGRRSGRVRTNFVRWRQRPCSTALSPETSTIRVGSTSVTCCGLPPH